MRINITLLITCIAIVVSAQTKNCGDMTVLRAIEDDDFTIARGTGLSDSWHFAAVYYFNQATASSAQEVAIDLDTIYIDYPDIVQPAVMSIAGEERLIWPWQVSTEITRDRVVGVPVPMVTEDCPREQWQSFELWYNDLGDARYKRRGRVVRYDHKIDSIAALVDEKVRRVQCETLPRSRTSIARSKNKPIRLSNAHCSPRYGKKVSIMVMRGEVQEYEGVELSDDGTEITFTGERRWRIVFAPGVVKLQPRGRDLTFKSNYKRWRS